MSKCAHCGEELSTHTEWVETGEGDVHPLHLCDRCCVNRLPESDPAHDARSCVYDPPEVE